MIQLSMNAVYRYKLAAGGMSLGSGFKKLPDY
jgi:hypothetical protein